jgi:NAD(P)-dependent dehydrogenase (short-subunit alcohol dehydrogenase family)
MASPQSWLTSKLALVTGGSGTIGLAIAKRLVEQGASVVLTGRRQDKLEEALSKIKQETVFPPGVSVVCIPCDVTMEASVVELFQKIEQMFEGSSVDLLVNNAGINIAGLTVDMPADDFMKVMNVNVLGPFLCAREAMKRMKQKKAGRIINIGSISAISSREDSAPYTASKFAMAGLSQSLSLDGRPHGIAVGIVHSGNVKSDMLTEEQLAKRSFEGFLDADNVAACVVTMACLPITANVLELTVTPTPQPLVGRG